MRPSLKQPQQQQQQLKKSRRAGFTLVELLVSISIIALLIGLLVPAIMGARRNALIRQVATEIGGLEAKLTDFNANFGVDPPSRITLYNSKAGWDGDSRSKSIIRRLWPQFDFNTDGSAGGVFSSTWAGNSITLDPAECLVFFLGGVRDTDGSFTGFSRNPAHPFSRGGSRLGPFIEFDMSRIIDSNANVFPEYLDTISGQSRPYLYFSSYDGRGYDCADWVLISGVYNVYRVGKGETDANRNCVVDSDEDKNNNGRLDYGGPHKAKTFQIISPGFDGEYGPLGFWDRGTADADLNDADHDGDGQIDPHERRATERDNITNFSNGTLAD